MTVIVTENGSDKLRGELTKWILEASHGTFVGNINALVREKLWDKVCNDKALQGAVMIYNSDSEQGFSMKMYGEPRRKVVDIEGIQLIEIVSQE